MKHNSHISSSKIWKNLIILAKVFSRDLANSELKFFAVPPPKRFADLSVQEFNQLVEDRHSALGDEAKKKTNWSVSTFGINNA